MVLWTLEIRHYRPVCNVLETGLYTPSPPPPPPPRLQEVLIIFHTWWRNSDRGFYTSSPCIKYVCTREAHPQYPWESFNEWQMNEIPWMNLGVITHPHKHCISSWVLYKLYTGWSSSNGKIIPNILPFRHSLFITHLFLESCSVLHTAFLAIFFIDFWLSIAINYNTLDFRKIL